MEINQEILNDVLSGEGHTLAIAGDGAQAVELARQGSFDLILMDLQMPVMDGIEAARQIRRLPQPKGSVPILALSAVREGSSEHQRCLDAGMNGSLAKPFDWAQITAALDRYSVSNPVATSAPSAEPRESSAIVKMDVLEHLGKLAGLGRVRQMVYDAMASYDGYCAGMIDPAASDAWIRTEAHKLRGSAGTMGLFGVTAVAALIEDAPEDNVTLPGLVRELEAMLAETRRQLTLVGVLLLDTPRVADPCVSSALPVAPAVALAPAPGPVVPGAGMEALQQAHDMLVSTIDATSEAILAVQPDGGMVMNIRMAEMWALPEEDISSLTLETLRTVMRERMKHPEQLDQLVDRLNNRPLEKSVDSIALMDGRFLTRTVAPQFIHGRCVGNVITYRDVTDSVRHEEEMAFNLQVIENSPPMFWIDSANGAITYVNPAACDHLGYTAAEFKKLKLKDFSVELTRDRVKSIFAGTANGGSVTYTNVHRRKDGVLRDVAVSIFLTELGRRSMFVITIKDITEQRRAELEAEHQQTLLLSLIDSMPDAIFYKDLEGRYQGCNKAYSERSGFSREQLIGRTADDLFPSARVEKIRARDSQAIASVVPVRLEELITKADGQEVFYETVISPLWGKDRSARGLLAVSRDITLRKQYEQDIRRAMEVAESATRSKSDFLANMSHEIRTPMNAIIGLSHLALEMDLAPRQRDYISKVQSAGQHLLGVINDILDFSKVEAGKLTLEASEFALQKVLDTTIDLCVGECDAKGLALIVDVGASVPPYVRGDSLRLGQVLVNLVNNAVKFTPSGQVEISVHAAECTEASTVLEFRVRDTGIGMSQDQIDRLFQSFSQADTSTTRRFGGTGLGLAISKKLAELMEGQIRVESALGQGSTFIFTARLGAVEDRSKDLVPRADLRGCRALVVDDSPHARTSIRDMLEKMTFVVTEAASGADAIEAVRAAAAAQAPFGIVYLDWRMPEMDGIETARRIKSLGLALPPVMMLVSSHSREEMLKDARAIGLKGVLVKPVNMSLLFDTTMDLLAPQAPSQVLSLPGSARSEAASGLQHIRGRRVLLVEDNDINQLVASGMLASVGLIVDVAENGAVALDMVQRNQYALVFMDMHMPVMDGVSSTRAIRKIEQLKRLPIIAMTANAMEQDRERCLESGMDAVVVKPIDPEVLWATLRQWIPAAEPATLPGPALAPAQPQPQAPEAALQARANAGAGPTMLLVEGLPCVEGLDTTLGMSRVLNKRPLYLTILRRFVTGNGSTATQIADALSLGDHAVAERLAHSCKSVAGNIGAGRLEYLAGCLESALRERHPAADIQARLREFERELIKMVAKLNTALPKEMQEEAHARRPTLVPVQRAFGGAG